MPSLMGRQYPLRAGPLRALKPSSATLQQASSSRAAQATAAPEVRPPAALAAASHRQRGCPVR
jgi:hypothetical protein